MTALSLKPGNFPPCTPLCSQGMHGDGGGPPLMLPQLGWVGGSLLELGLAVAMAPGAGPQAPGCRKSQAGGLHAWQLGAASGLRDAFQAPAPPGAAKAQLQPHLRLGLGKHPVSLYNRPAGQCRCEGNQLGLFPSFPSRPAIPRHMDAGVGDRVLLTAPIASSLLWRNRGGRCDR